MGYYRLGDVLGACGTGVLYHGCHVVTDVQVAVEVLQDAGSLAEQIVAGATAARAVHHPNLVDVIDVGSMPDGTVFVVTESLEGQTLEARLRRVARLPLFEAINILRQMAHGLGTAHEAGLVHGGLHPDNIFLCPRRGRRRIVRHSPATAMDLAVEPEGCFDLVKLFDLGLAGVGDFAAQTAARGTPIYRAPEQAEGKPAERSSDIYALGAIFYEMITGTPPFQGAPPSDILGKSLAGVVTMASRRAPGAGIDGPIDDMILKCLKKTPRLRFANTTELCEALESCVTDCAFLRDAHPRRRTPTMRKTPPAIPPHARLGSATVRKLPSVPMTTKSSRPPGVASPLPPPIPRTHSAARGKAEPPPIPRSWKPTTAKKRSTSEAEKPIARAAVLQKISLPDRLIPLPKIAAPSPVARVTPPPIPLTSDLLTELTEQA